MEDGVQACHGTGVRASCFGSPGQSVPWHASCGEGGLASSGWQDLDKLAMEEEGELLWNGTPGPAISWEASCGRGVCSYLSLALLGLSILVKFSNGGGGAASSVWLHRAFPALWRPAVEEGGVASLALLLRSCLDLDKPAVEERGILFLAWHPRECPVLGSQ